MADLSSIAGRAWCFGDDISTDLLAPGEYTLAGVEERARHTLEALNARFATEVQPGDIVVAGRNFGCGSSRESAPENLKVLGVACVVADSFARIFLRNAVAIGLPVLTCRGLRESSSDGDEIELDLGTGRVRNLRSDAELHGEPLPPEMRQILASGGILAALRDFGTTE